MQVHLDPLEHEAHKRKATEQGISMSELTRRIGRERLGLGKRRGALRVITARDSERDERRRYRRQ